MKLFFTAVVALCPEWSVELLFAVLSIPCCFLLVWFSTWLSGESFYNSSRDKQLFDKKIKKPGKDYWDSEW